MSERVACQLPQFLHSFSRMPLPKPRPIQPKARPIQPKARPVQANAMSGSTGSKGPSEPEEPPPWVKLGINKPPAAAPVPCLWMSMAIFWLHCFLHRFAGSCKCAENLPVLRPVRADLTGMMLAMRHGGRWICCVGTFFSQA
jgi:hypothetical protein